MNLKGRVLVQAHGLGVDSTAVTTEFVRRGIRPDALLFADTGGEKAETYAYIDVLNEFLTLHGFPTLTVVRYAPQDFKNYPPYHSLEENCLTNGTLPSLAFGFHMKSCSIKWKQAPQNKWCSAWEPARAAWRRGDRVVKVIGYDAGAADTRRRYKAGNEDDPKYEYWYPLAEWGWDRDRCKAEIVRAGLPVPLKSSCFFCPAMQTWEVAALPPEKLRRIVLIEARAKPRLQSIDGLWGRGCKGTRGGRKRPGAMTDFIRAEKLLPADEIDRIIAEAPKELIDRQQAFANGKEIPDWSEFFCELNDGPSFCGAAEEEA